MAKTKTPIKKPMLCCHHCSGSGKLEMSDELFAVLQLASETVGISAGSVCHKLNWKGNPTAMNNRLEDLRHLGFLKREKRSGKTWVYFKLPKP